MDMILEELKATLMYLPRIIHSLCQDIMEQLKLLFAKLARQLEEIKVMDRDPLVEMDKVVQVVMDRDPQVVMDKVDQVVMDEGHLVVMVRVDQVVMADLKEVE